MDRDVWAPLVSRYAERLHARVAGEHHVASPLGAWLLLALCAPLVDEERHGALSDIVGPDPLAAARVAAALLADPPPLVVAAAGAWTGLRTEAPRLRAWLNSLPGVVATGDVPTQAQADAWARAHSLGLIESFPLALPRELALLLASAVATKISWEVPFDVVGAEELGPSPWTAQLASVLRTPRDPRHRQLLVQSERTGLLGVHLAGAAGLLVGSVIALDPSVAPSDVLAVAHTIVTAEARAHGASPRRSLFDVPLADGPVLSVAEEPVSTTAPGGKEERFVSVIPAWRAQTTLDLYEDELGFPCAAQALAGAMELEQYVADARQTSVARYTAVGFEAAAMTALALAVAARLRSVEGLRRTATLRFGHPYAVVAACQEAPNRPGARDPWVGLPVFSGWVTTPSDA